MTSTDFENLTLANVADGKLEELFQEQLDEARPVLEDADRYERDKDDVITMTVMLEVTLARQGTDSMVAFDVRASLKRPRRKRVGRTHFYVEGAFTVARAKQSALPFA